MEFCKVILSDPADGHELYNSLDSNVQVVLILRRELLKYEFDHGGVLRKQISKHFSR